MAGAAGVIGCGLVVVAVAASGLLTAPAKVALQAPPSVRNTISPTDSALAIPDATRAPSAESTAAPLTPLVPVAEFWSTARDVTFVDVARLWAGLPETTTETQYKSLAVAAADVGPFAQLLDITPAKSVADTRPRRGQGRRPRLGLDAGSAAGR